MKQVIIVSAGYGNLRSVERALRRAGDDLGQSLAVTRSADPEVILRSDQLVVPGQGHFGDAARVLGQGTGQAVLEYLRSGKPYLGICLGLQVLFERSAEAPGVAGLGWFRGSVEKLSVAPGIKIPHMGWNALEARHGGHPALDACGGQGSWVYFVHSYHAQPEDPAIVKATVEYGPHQVTAMVARDNVLATQFHPEKSQGVGLQLLRAFLSGTALP